MQQLWLKGVDWDEDLPEDLRSYWQKWYSSLTEVAKIRIPRWDEFSPVATSIEMHGFSDASIRVYGSVLYMRLCIGDVVKITLLQSKSKVAPTNTLSVPRLELCGALLLARLAWSCSRELRVEQQHIHLWTDSTDVLYWLQSHPSRWQSFVANRCSSIHELLPDVHWHHVRSADNSADILSRGATSQELLESDIWWKGPSWLQSSREDWPPAVLSLAPSRIKEERKSVCIAHVAIEETDVSNTSLLSRFGCISALLRFTVLRFRVLRRATCKFQRKTWILEAIMQLPVAEGTMIEADELLHVRQFWIRLTQNIHFQSEIKALEGGKNIASSSKLTKFTPRLCEGVLCVGGRLKNAMLEPDEMHPIILPEKSPLTDLLVREAHETALHGGAQLTLTTLRRRYWIICGRQVVKSYIHRCTKCIRQACPINVPKMGDLPAERVQLSLPFDKVGLDYAGPFFVRSFTGRGHTAVKYYVAVFTCFVFKGVHLELVFKCDTPSVLAALKRFISRRGHPSEIWSDCGTNFVGADNELKQWMKEKQEIEKGAAQFAAESGVRWRFNPPGSPHFGGLWEAAVKSMKFHLKRVVGDAKLTSEEFLTLLCQVEACLNSRPITTISDDVKDSPPLTASRILTGRFSLLVSEPRITDDKLSPSQRWKMITQMTQHFWDRWSAEYLQQLQARNKWKKDSPSLRIGDVVLIKHENTPPTVWPMARILKMHPGKDGVVRVCTLKTAVSVLQRAVHKLILLVPAREDYK